MLSTGSEVMYFICWSFFLPCVVTSRFDLAARDDSLSCSCCCCCIAIEQIVRLHGLKKKRNKGQVAAKMAVLTSSKHEKSREIISKICCRLPSRPAIYGSIYIANELPVSRVRTASTGKSASGPAPPPTQTDFMTLISASRKVMSQR